MMAYYLIIIVYDCLPVIKLHKGPVKSALPIFIDDNTKHFLHLIGRKITSYLFSLYLGTNLLHFPFFPL